MKAVDVDHLEVDVSRNGDEQLIAKELRLDLLREGLRLELELVRLVREDTQLLNFSGRSQKLRRCSEIHVRRKPNFDVSFRIFDEFVEILGNRSHVDQQVLGSEVGKNFHHDFRRQVVEFDSRLVFIGACVVGVVVVRVAGLVQDSPELVLLGHILHETRRVRFVDGGLAEVDQLQELPALLHGRVKMDLILVPQFSLEKLGSRGQDDFVSREFCFAVVADEVDVGEVSTKRPQYFSEVTRRELKFFSHFFVF